MDEKTVVKSVRLDRELVKWVENTCLNHPRIKYHYKITSFNQLVEFLLLRLKKELEVEEMLEEEIKRKTEVS